MEKEQKTSVHSLDGAENHPLETSNGGPTATPPPFQLKAQGEASSSAPIQRQVKIGAEETYSSENITDFFMKYGMDHAAALGVTEHSVKIMEMINTGDHAFESIEAFLESLGWKMKTEPSSAEEEENLLAKLDALEVGTSELGASKGPPTLKVTAIHGVLGDWPGLAEGTPLTLTISKKKSSRDLFETSVGGQACMLKSEVAGKSEFDGLRIQAEHGVRIPKAASVTLEDGSLYLLMGFEKYLSEGLGSANVMSPDEMQVAAEGMGRMHIADIKMCNVDRLPWRGNGYTGHWFNVFFDAISREAIGLDSEAHLEITETMRKDVEAELEEIRANPQAYAEKIYKILSTKADKDKLLADEKKGPAFIKGFATGLMAGLKV